MISATFVTGVSQVLKATKDDQDCYQIGLCHMNAKDESRQALQFQIIAKAISFVCSEVDYK